MTTEVHLFQVIQSNMYMWPGHRKKCTWTVHQRKGRTDQSLYCLCSDMITWAQMLGGRWPHLCFRAKITNQTTTLHCSWVGLNHRQYMYILSSIRNQVPNIIQLELWIVFRSYRFIFSSTYISWNSPNGADSKEFECLIRTSLFTV
jgi:hypothetical protein